MSGLVDRITEVLRKHKPATRTVPLGYRVVDMTVCTGCDWGGEYLTEDDHAEHVAERVAAELQLTEEWGVMALRDTEPYPVFDFRAPAEKTAAARHQHQIESVVVSRLVSEWTPVQDES